MRTYGLRIAVLAAVLSTGWMPTAKAEGIPWGKNWDAGKTAAKQSGKLMMVDFYTDWCGWCKKLDADVYPSPIVVKAAAQFVPLRLNAEKEGLPQAKQYGVNAFPTMLFFDSSGAVVGRIIGYEPVPQFSADLDRIAAAERDLPGLKAHVQAHPDDMTGTLRLATILAQRGQMKDAEPLITVLQQNTPPAQMTGLYTQIGDGYNDQNDTADATAWYLKTIAASTDPDELLKTHIKLFQTYAAHGPKDKAIAELQAILDLPKAPDALKTQVRAIMAQMKAPPKTQPKEEPKAQPDTPATK